MGWREASQNCCGWVDSRQTPWPISLLCLPFQFYPLCQFFTISVEGAIVWFPQACSVLDSRLHEGSLYLTPLTRFRSTLLHSRIFDVRTRAISLQSALEHSSHLQGGPIYWLLPPLLLPTTRIFAISVDLSVWRFLVPGSRPVENVAFVSGIFFFPLRQDFSV